MSPTPHHRLHYVPQNEVLVRQLIEAGVQFIVVGGRAVRYYCPDRADDDLDILVNPTIENATRVLGVLGRINPSSSQISPQDLAGPRKQIRIMEQYHIDMITPSSRQDFPSIYAASDQTTLSDMAVRIAPIGTLIEMKLKTGDSRDQRDIAALQAVLARKCSPGMVGCASRSA